MAVNWTTNQKKVIDLRERNILVSAAAGSGKTAVLVERIIQMISDESNPVDVDKLLVVTFTKAAADEMRERIGDALDKKLEENPKSTHLRKQATLLHNAKISTIHSFCLYVIKNYFHTIDFDPNFRIADDGEIKLLKEDTINEILEGYYERGDEEFLDFVENYIGGKNDQGIKSLVEKIFQVAQSVANPKEWLDYAYRIYAAESIEEFLKSDLIKFIEQDIYASLDGLLSVADYALTICDEVDGPYIYREMLEADRDFLERAKDCEDFRKLQQVIGAYSPMRLSGKRNDDINPEKKEYVKGLRDKIKDGIKNICSKYLKEDIETVFNITCLTGKRAKVLIDITKDFIDLFAKKKEDKRIVDFGDLEHFALKILMDENGKQTRVAKDLSMYYKEVMVDEYQDINQVQDALLRLVSKEEMGENNLFMVGDVKQSIYKFRLAMPEIFIDKYNTYSIEDSEKQKVVLGKNFRSHPHVLKSINYIFYQIMIKELGGIEYNKEAALNPGRDYYEDGDNTTELILVEGDPAQEAYVIGQRIQELVAYNDAKYSDIVILSRAISAYGENLRRTLEDMGIPVRIDSRTGYFSTLEIQLILSLLNVIDNPLSDIPLTAVLNSFIGGFDENELALLRTVYGEGSIYKLICLAAKEDNKKAEAFLEMLKDFREKTVYMPINELINYIYDKTGFMNYMSAMPGGSVRRANLYMLVEKAAAFENTSYKGLFNFNRYISALMSYEVDYGEAEVLEENDNSVRLMTIHKSKGLEFKYVILAGIGRDFNTSDTKDKVVLHSTYGLGMDYIDIERNIKVKGLTKEIIGRVHRLENLAEEIRVLYVALTRAKEKLIMVGELKEPMKFISDFKMELDNDEQQLSFNTISKAKSFASWIIPSMMRHKSFEPVLEELGFESGNYIHLEDFDAPFEIKIIKKEDLVIAESVENLKSDIKKSMIISGNFSYDKDVYEFVDDRMKFSYKYADEVNLKTKVSVSELKHSAILELEEEEVYQLIQEEEIPLCVPEFIEKTKQMGGAYKGSVYHKVLELLDFNEVHSYRDLESCLDKLVSDGYLMPEERVVIYLKDLMGFLESPLGVRMAKASKAGLLKKEQPFVLGIEANEVIQNSDSKEIVLVQGIIDAFFEEDECLVLMDYKTDRVESSDELVKRYSLQLDLYQRALETITGKKVKEKIIYSFALKKEISW